MAVNTRKKRKQGGLVVTGWDGEEVVFYLRGNKVLNVFQTVGTTGTKAWPWHQEGLLKQQEEGGCDWSTVSWC